MPYQDRLNQAVFESPSGQTFSFSYRVVARSFSHRIGSFEFPGINGTLHQDKGMSGGLYPLTVFIHGENYDTEADRFNDAMLETGNGFLTHPRWGRLRVQVLGHSQDEDLTAAAGQAVFNVKFQESLAKEFPETEPSLQFEVPAQADNFQTAAVDNFTDQVKTPTLSDKNAFKQDMIDGAVKVETALQDVASVDQTVAAKFRGYIDDISNNVDAYVLEPYGYATSVSSAIRVVAEVPGRVGSKLQGYINLLDVLTFKDVANTLNQTRNSVLVDELIGTVAIVASGESINTTLRETSSVKRDATGKATMAVPAAGTGFQTRAETLAASVLLRDQFTALVFLLDDSQTVFKNTILSNSYIQAIESYSPAAQVISNVIKAALDLSFSLPAERRLLLTIDRTVPDLCYQFYKNVDDAILDYFILTNELDGEEIITVPRGREVLYYA